MTEEKPLSTKDKLIATAVLTLMLLIIGAVTYMLGIAFYGWPI